MECRQSTEHIINQWNSHWANIGRADANFYFCSSWFIGRYTIVVGICWCCCFSPLLFGFIAFHENATKQYKAAHLDQICVCVCMCESRRHNIVLAMRIHMWRKYSHVTKRRIIRLRTTCPLNWYGIPFRQNCLFLFDVVRLCVCAILYQIELQWVV